MDPLESGAGQGETVVEIANAPDVSDKPPYGHPDYEFPPEVYNLLITAQTGHITLSGMADSKASILMGATFVVFTLTLGQISSLDKAPMSLLLLGFFSFVATVFSVLAIRPKLGNPPPVAKPGMNLTYFGTFSNIPEEEYIDSLITVLRSQDATYRMMARDLYQNGRVLFAKKFRYLSYAYTTFLAGIVATFVAFTWELLRRH